VAEQVVHVHRGPLQAGALGEHRAQADQADRHHGAAGQGEGRGRVQVGFRPVRQQPAAGQDRERRERGRGDEEVRAGVGGDAYREGGGRRADQAAQAPEAVHAGHHRPAVALLDEHGLRVHRHVGEAGRGAEHDQGGAQQHQRRRQRRQQQGRAVAEEEDADQGAQVVPVHQAAGQRHGEDGADPRHQQGDAQPADADPDVGRDPRHPGGEGAHDRAVHREHHGRRGPGLAQPARCTRAGGGHGDRVCHGHDAKRNTNQVVGFCSVTVEVPRGYAKGRAKRREILDQAMALFGEAGYRGTSLRDVAARCGLSHPGLLHHFPTKESLLLAVLEHRDEVDRQWLSRHPAGLAALRGLVELAARNATRPGIVELFTVLSAEATAAEHPAHAYFVERYRRTVGAVERAYAQVRDGGELRAGVEPAAAARQFVSLMDGLQIQWLLTDRRIDMAAILRAHLDAQLVPA
jgi:AcrR family transcriptional regulator